MNIENISIQKKIIIGNTITSILLAVLCAVVWNVIMTLNTTSDMVEHTYKVIDNSNGLVNSMVDQETGLRGFAVGGQDDYLEPYIQGKKKFSNYLQTAKQLTSDNPTQQKRFDDVADAAASWQAYAERMIEIRKDIRKGEATNSELQTLISSGIGKRKMDGLRKEIASGQFGYMGDKILNAMVNMETGLRGFMLNRKDHYLEPYNEGKQTVLSSLASIQGTKLASHANEWIDNYAEKAITLVRKANKFKNRKELYQEFSKKQGKQYMDGLR
ncbi:MAG: chemotaxis protein, partial [Alteromonadales bacterium]|nr:chemotaxis protein [Alteromonadales bacterium]